MKCGGDDDVSYGNDRFTGTATIAGTATTWTLEDLMPEGRRYHNLTVVPDGRVLMTGGVTPGLPELPRRRPVFWTASDDWVVAPELESDPLIRRYHSTALLLPDGRVLCAGGIPTDMRATVFSPPYLYAPDHSLAARCSITSHPTATVHYGEPFYLGIQGAPLDSVAILSLIRPGATTHAFDQNQRFVQLSGFTRPHGMLRAVLPADSNHVPPGDYMLFAVRTGVGGVPSVAKWIRVGREDDTAAPAAITGLTIQSMYTSSAVLNWTSPGDDGTAGTASAYDLRYSTSPITAANFAQCPVVATDPPRLPGQTESYFVGQLAGCTPYYFAMKTRDERYNWSTLSNVPNGSTMCGGGGGGSEFPPSARPGVGPVASVVPGMAAHELTWLGRVDGGARTLNLVQAGAVPVRVDSLALIAVPVGVDTVATLAGGQICRGTKGTPLGVTARGDDVRAAIAASGYVTAPGETVVVRRDSPSIGTVVIEALPAPETTPGAGITVEDRGRLGWRRRGTWFPGAGRERIVVHTVGGDSVRLVAHGSYTLLAVEEIVPIDAVVAGTVVPIERIEHSSEGTLSLAPGAAAATGATLETSERLAIGFAGPAGAGAWDLFLRVWTSAPRSGLLTAKATAGNPAEFALRQNRPNPFADGTAIEFALPSRMAVTVEVFDLHGRRVKSLTRATWPAGVHTVSWDGRDGSGSRVRPGIYWYRIAAGTFRASRRLVLLP